MKNIFIGGVFGYLIGGCLCSMFLLNYFQKKGAIKDVCNC